MQIQMYYKQQTQTQTYYEIEQTQTTPKLTLPVHPKNNVFAISFR